MKRRPFRRRLMIMDACELIDYIKAERAMLELVVKHVRPLHVTSPVVDEVNEIEDAYAAVSRSGPLSFEDWVCLLTAKRQGFTCITNDKNLRKFCKQEGFRCCGVSSLSSNCTGLEESLPKKPKRSHD